MTEEERTKLESDVHFKLGYATEELRYVSNSLNRVLQRRYREGGMIIDPTLINFLREGIDKTLRELDEKN